MISPRSTTIRHSNERRNKWTQLHELMTMFNKVSFLCFFALRENRFLSSLMHLSQLLFSRANCRIIVSVYTHCCWWTKHDDTDFYHHTTKMKGHFLQSFPIDRFDVIDDAKTWYLWSASLWCIVVSISFFLMYFSSTFRFLIPFFFTDNITSVIHIVSHGWKQYHSLFQRTEW